MSGTGSGSAYFQSTGGRYDDRIQSTADPTASIGTASSARYLSSSVPRPPPVSTSPSLYASSLPRRRAQGLPPTSSTSLNFSSTGASLFDTPSGSRGPVHVSGLHADSFFKEPRLPPSRRGMARRPSVAGLPSLSGGLMSTDPFGSSTMSSAAAQGHDWLSHTAPPPSSGAPRRDAASLPFSSLPPSMTGLGDGPPFTSHWSQRRPSAASGRPAGFSSGHQHQSSSAFSSQAYQTTIDDGDSGDEGTALGALRDSGYRGQRLPRRATGAGADPGLSLPGLSQSTSRGPLDSSTIADKPSYGPPIPPGFVRSPPDPNRAARLKRRRSSVAQQDSPLRSTAAGGSSSRAYGAASFEGSGDAALDAFAARISAEAASRTTARSVPGAGGLNDNFEVGSRPWHWPLPASYVEQRNEEMRKASQEARRNM